LKNSFTDLFVIIPKRASVDLSREMNFFSKEQAYEFATANEEVIRSACGIFCLQMIFSFYRTPTPLLENLNAELTYSGAFNVVHGMILSKIDPVLQKYGMRGQFFRNISAKTIFSYLLQGIPVISSISGDQGGHLVVLVGVSIEERKINSVLYLDPNNTAAQSLVKVKFEKWEKLFNHRALVVSQFVRAKIDREN
jgi:hypothetical protein